MSAIGGKADISRTFPNVLLTQSGHQLLAFAATHGREPF